MKGREAFYFHLNRRVGLAKKSGMHRDDWGTGKHFTVPPGTSEVALSSRGSGDGLAAMASTAAVTSAKARLPLC